MLCDTYIFYADVYFIQNFLIKVAVLYCSLYMNKYYFSIQTIRGILKVVFVAILGTAMEVLGLFYCESYLLFLLMVNLLEIPIMFSILLRKMRRQMLKLIISGYFFLMLINATLELLWNWFGQENKYVFLLTVSCLVVHIGTGIYQNYNSVQKGRFPVEILHHKHHICTYGYYDSGNRLRDPYTGKGVHIISKNVFSTLELEGEASVLIPYQALGKEDGLLEIYYIEEMIIGEEIKKHCWKKCPVGVTKEDLFNKKEYELVLNEEVF